MAMTINHRYFVQYMLNHGVTTVDKALAYCKHVSQGRIENMTQLKTLIIEINREISKQFYKMTFCVCEVTNQNIVVWLNTKNDEISKMQIHYSAIELEYFNAILQEILNSEEHRITFIVCINITSSLTSIFSRDSGQKVLNRWLKGGYYIKREGYIYLGPRTILEFTAYLRSNCPDSICNLCSELVFTGRKCGHCDKILHSYCISTYLKTQIQCPCCKNDWIQVEMNDEQDNYTVDSEMDFNGTEHIDAMSTGLYNRTAINTDSQSDISELPSTSSGVRRSQRSGRLKEDYRNDLEEAGPRNKKRQK